MPKPRALTETQFQQQVLDLAQLRGWSYYHTHDSQHAVAGFPDLVLVHVRQKRIVFAELKKVGGKVSDAQRDWLANLRAAGAETAAWWPGDLEEIKAILAGKPITGPTLKG